MGKKSKMLRHVWKKLLWHTFFGAGVWLLVRRLSPWGSVYAGWTAGLMGSCYLLAGWINWMKCRGTDLGALLRRRRPPEVPYYLRGADKSVRPRLSLNGLRHSFDDDLAETADPAAQTLAREELWRVRAVALAAAGVFLLTLSAF